jgi:hypothetical protein
MVREFLDFIREVDEQATQVLRDGLEMVWDDVQSWWASKGSD